MAVMLLGLGPFAGAAPASVAVSEDALPALMSRLNQFRQLHLGYEQRATGPGAERQQGRLLSKATRTVPFRIRRSAIGCVGWRDDL